MQRFWARDWRLFTRQGCGYRYLRQQPQTGPVSSQNLTLVHPVCTCDLNRCSIVAPKVQIFHLLTQFLNSATAWLDLEQIYGSNPASTSDNYVDPAHSFRLADPTQSCKLRTDDSWSFHR